jgi:type II secretory pathway pseudopilin PulG
MELLIAIAIFTILSGIVLMGFRQVRKLDELKQSSLELVSRLREAQNLAMTGQLTKTATGTEVPIGGYGLHLNLSQTKYQIFADFQYYNTDISTGVGCKDGANERYDNDPVIVNKCIDEKVNNIDYALNNNVKFDTVEIDGIVQNPLLLLDITFKPPKPVPFVGYGESDEARMPGESKPGSTVEICLKHQTTGKYRKITVIGASGQINEEPINTSTCP